MDAKNKSIVVNAKGSLVLGTMMFFVVVGLIGRGVYSLHFGGEESQMHLIG